MTFNPVFVPVLGSIIEPNLKVRAEITDRRMDTSDAAIRVYYDPQLGPDRLTMAYPEDLRLLLAKDGYEPPRQEVVFESSESREILSLPLRIKKENGNVILRVPSDNHGIQLSATILEKANVPTIKGNYYDVLYIIIESIILISYVDRHKNKINDFNSGSIFLYVSRSAAEEFSIRTTFDFDRTMQGDVLVAERRISS